jgi:acyl-CoA synthetase (NDP forming)
MPRRRKAGARDEPAVAADLDVLFHPRAIAVVGASANPDSPGHDYVRSLLDFGFAGQIYPVNPRLSEMLGLRAYRRLADTPEPVDYVISCVPAEAVLAVVDECREKGVRALQLFTGRFSETGREGAALLEGELKRRALAARVRVIGPNCLGLYYPAGGLSFRPDLPKVAGRATLLSQSGNNAVELMCHAAARGVRFSKVVSYGNALDLNESDFLGYAADDGETDVVAAYLEGVSDGRRFHRALAKASGCKPVVVLKGGRTAAGARSARSHTAALAGTRQVWSAALRQAGAVEVDTSDELIDMLVAFSFARPGVGRRVGVVGGGGGRSVQSADACEEAGLTIVPLPDEVRARLRERVPLLGDWVGNPVDQSVLAGGGLSGVQVLEMMAATASFDVLIANVGEDWILGRPDAEARLRHVTERFIQVGGGISKPLAVVLGPAEWPEDWRRRLVEETRERLTEAGLAVYPSVERAARAVRRLAACWEERETREGDG